MHIDEFDYDLPEGLIAQQPLEKRNQSRLMVINKQTGSIKHHNFDNILDYLQAGDCLVLNDSKVIPARLFGTKKDTGAKIEFLLIKQLNDDHWETMVKPGKRVKPGDIIIFGENEELSAEVLEYGEDGTRTVHFDYEGVFLEILDRVGHMPLPPYIKRESRQSDKNRYQTVYSKNEGSVAAPTAGLHFTNELIAALQSKGINIAYVTLHVGIGTFKPVKADNILDHHMHFEEYHINEKNAKIINDTKASGGRIIAVGTTSTRTLESVADEQGRVHPTAKSTDLFIYPGYQYKIVDGLITNFHLPKSTLLMLVSAFYNKEGILDAYQTAVKEEYRFFSYGDAMFIY
ncbi:MAG: tRNA preQ1(34) S-adenosylmethionine ribosyltransferase-isomerase QueA [Clostridia bacterium]|nr:tRNA preQ1(34) S-adenosylmethionine ribosyltransferase-isomerase QueA [Clostridia bacterium]